MLLIRRRRPVGESRGVDLELAGDADQIVAPLGGNRIADALRGFGPELVPPANEPVTHWLPDLDSGGSSLAARDLGARFEVVVLASHLINTSLAEVRAALVVAAARHLAADGRLLVEHHPLDWLETAAESWSEGDGQRLGMIDVRVNPPLVSAVSVYEVGSEVVRQPFTARVLSDDELHAALEAAGLTVTRRLSPTWLEAASRGASAR